MRTQFTCVICRYCYSCHWKLEKVESERDNSAVIPQPAMIAIEQSSTGQQQIMAMDVYGQQIEPICNYRTCNHKFSEHGHGNHKCKCHHAFNHATGVSISRLS